MLAVGFLFANCLVFVTASRNANSLLIASSIPTDESLETLYYRQIYPYAWTRQANFNANSANTQRSLSSTSAVSKADVYFTELPVSEGDADSVLGRVNTVIVKLYSSNYSTDVTASITLPLNSYDQELRLWKGTSLAPVVNHSNFEESLLNIKFTVTAAIILLELQNETITLIRDLTPYSDYYPMV
jgi:hypothetical protein